MSLGTPTKPVLRPPEATFSTQSVTLAARRQPKTWEYYAKSVIIGTLGEAAFRCLKLTDILSFRKLDDLTNLSHYIPFAKGEEVINAAANAAANATQSAAGAVQSTCSDSLPAVISDSCVYFESNSEWLLLTGGIAFAAASVNHLASEKIKNVYVRNPVSLVLGGAIVWGAATAMGYPVSVYDIADIGLRLLVTNGIGRLAAPAGQGLLRLTHASLELTKWGFAYPNQHSKVKGS
ncbi:MAG: hypothetical protein K1000chlam2_00288 [Chlamydiae bacterium]|nr:hypothetical protein [Chlamydiota bacterium]